MPVTVSPREFTMVSFDAGEIARIADRVREDAGLPADLEIRVQVDERSPAARVSVHSVEPLVLTVESGAFENPKKIRTLSEAGVADVLGVQFLQAADRLDPTFGAPDIDAELTLAHRVAWDITAVGRLDRLGYRVQRPRRIYHFRNRHGFSDASDAIFEHLWAQRPATWAGLAAASDAARAASLVA